MRLLTTCLLILTMLSPLAAQVSSTQKQEMWRLRTEAITDNLLNDAQQLSPLRRAELLAKLGHRWWNYDQRRASGWFENAIEIVEQAPKNENADERRQRFETARTVLNSISPFDQKLAGRLVGLLSDKQVASDSERIENADRLMQAARNIAQIDPKRGAELGAQALRQGPPTQIAGLFNTLYQSDSRLAEDFLLQAMAVAKQDPYGLLLNSLTYILFPTPRRYVGYNSPSPVPPRSRTLHVKDPYISPDNLRIEVLQLDIAFLNASRGKGIDCASVFTFISPVMDEFERLLPQQAATARQAMNECGFSNRLTPPEQPPADGSKKRVFVTLALNTVETLLEVAGETTEVQARTSLKQRAALLALTNKEYERALKILDDMAPEERQSMGSWEQIRPHWAAGAAWEHYKNNRIREMNLILDGVPPDVQPLAKIEFMQRSISISDPRPLERDLALRLLKEARTALRRSSLPEMKKYGWHFALIGVLLKYDPPAAGAAFKEAVASLNRAEQEKENKDLKLLDYMGLAGGLPHLLIEMDEDTVKDGIAAIVSVESRAQLRLEFVSETLRRTGAPNIP